MQGQWFESWFDSPWYPILYDHRDHNEAEDFISHLLERLEPAACSAFLDLACGRGRHSRYIHAHGFDVTGLDLSPASIADARLHEATGLRFAVQDMRTPFPGRYDFILNLFTSFGYFESRADNLLVLNNVAAALKPGGKFVMDFFNLEVVRRGMVPHSTIEKKGVRFDIHKRVENGIIIKEIDLVDQGQAHHFEERVQALGFEELKSLISAARMQVTDCWGDYQGHAFDLQTSPRLILFAELGDGQERMKA